MIKNFENYWFDPVGNGGCFYCICDETSGDEFPLEQYDYLFVVYSLFGSYGGFLCCTINKEIEEQE